MEIDNCKYYSDGVCLENNENKVCDECSNCYFKIAQINQLAFQKLLGLYKSYVRHSSTNREEEMAKEIEKLKGRIRVLRRRNIKLSQEIRNIKRKKRTSD